MISFVVGWLLFALGAGWGTKFMTPKMALGLVGTALVVTGAMTSRMAFNAGKEAPEWARWVFLTGWGLIAATLIWNSASNINRILAVVGTLIVLAGVMTHRYSEKTNNKDASIMGRIAFVSGWVVLVLSAALRV